MPTSLSLVSSTINEGPSAEVLQTTIKDSEGLKTIRRYQAWLISD